MMAIDPVPNGFGPLSQTFGPLLLISGIILPIFGLITTHPSFLVKNYVQLFGFIISTGISFSMYIISLEPTASLWDCSETIAAAYKLQIPHTPGTPLTLLIGRIFSMLSFGDVSKVAWFINLMSSVFSALAVGFTFLLIWYFGKSLIQSKWVLFFGSLGGAFCMAFSDSFWFSAVEAETYGISIFCMVFMIWLSTQGKNLEKSEKRNLILLHAYLFGLSYCIHPMCILVIPVCVLIWRFNEGYTDWKQIIISFGVGIISILFISKIIAVDIFEWAFKLDLFLVNTWSLPFYSGVFTLILLLSVFFGFIWIRYQKSRLLLFSTLLLLTGFSPYLMLFVRSSQLPPINEFTPNNLAKIKPYMNRESYPGRPLLYGPYFDAKIDKVSTKASAYIIDDNQYKAIGEVLDYQYEKNRSTIFPRIYSNKQSHINTYQKWTGLREGEIPKFSNNLSFMFRYQIGHMYVRYLMWNFAGRESDHQHAGWLTPWEPTLERTSLHYNKANNQYFMIPLLLGLLGIVLQFKRDPKGFISNLSFFLITGLLLVIYLNATPNEPRERDYIYVGSYVAFSIWVGLGIMKVASLISHQQLSKILAAILLIVPIWIFYQNLDDHDRSDRTFQMDHAKNVLSQCEPGGILFTGGDNDTFPLWYLQEVEGFRTDVRVIVLSYFNSDWYINQLSRQYYNSPPLKLSLKINNSQYGPYDPLYVQETIQTPISFGKYLNALKSKNPRLMIQSTAGSNYYYLPSRQLDLSTTKGALNVKVNGSYLPKSELAILDIIYSNDWDRSIYFNFTSINSLSIDLNPYMSQEGLVYKLTPNNNGSGNIEMDLDKSYENLITNVNYTNLSNPDVYFNYEDYEARMINPIKFNINSMINNYLNEGEKNKAIEISTYALEHLYFDHARPSYAEIQLAKLLIAFGNEYESNRLLFRTFEYYYHSIVYQMQLGKNPTRNDLIVLQEAIRIIKDPDKIKKYEDLINKLNSKED